MLYIIGKDVPSKASEFAHPDVIIGLSVLAYRFTDCIYMEYYVLTNHFDMQIFGSEEGRL